MAFQPPDSLGSGRPYAVVDVAGEVPVSLDQFLREADFGIERDGMVCRIRGVGADRGGKVRFHEKDVEHSGKDVRVWSVRREADGQFLAEALSLF